MKPPIALPLDLGTGHIAPEETYRLDTSDLRMTEILPDKPW